MRAKRARELSRERTESARSREREAAETRANAAAAGGGGRRRPAAAGGGGGARVPSAGTTVFIETLPAEDHHRRLRPAHKVYQVPYILVHSSRIPQPTPFKMPKTRSKTAQRSSNGDTDQQQSSEGTTTEASSATTTTTTTTATTTTEGNTDRTTTTDTSTENTAKHHKHIQTSRFRSHNRLCGRPTTVGKRSQHVQLAAARLAALETEETDSEEDENTVVQDQETQKRVGNWVDTQMETLATIDAPHQKNGTTGQKQQNTDELATAAKIDTPPAVCATSTRPASETEQKKQTEIPTAVHATETSPTQHSRPEHIAPLQSTGNMITELATALTRRAGASSAYDLPTFYGAHQEWLMFKASYVDTRTSFTEHENMLRLRKSLRGKAKDAVRNLLNYSKNSETVMNALENASDDPTL
ncbi:hypothetical protein EVAR_39673_1 [Eumeta japonica]|uniref:Uncharacterized protein n=1 Tax=Eumeta variegata TaxID=151549 RepID=A0A4C1Z7A8_EUMVA|nr:hypothetical protein EVAR_39673_1 [Eumeta japonica]